VRGGRKIATQEMKTVTTLTTYRRLLSLAKALAKALARFHMA
jgi:hypothetical protein